MFVCIFVLKFSNKKKRSNVKKINNKAKHGKKKLKKYMYKKRASVFYYRDYDFELVLFSFFSEEKKGEIIHYINNINIAKRNLCREYCTGFIDCEK